MWKDSDLKIVKEVLIRRWRLRRHLEGIQIENSEQLALWAVLQLYKVNQCSLLLKELLISINLSNDMPLGNPILFEE